LKAISLSKHYRIQPLSQVSLLRKKETSLPTCTAQLLVIRLT